MKRIVVLAVLILLNIKGIGQPKRIQDIAGRWEIAGEENSGYALEITDSATIVLTYMGEKKKIIDYRIDFSKSPLWFDFSIQDPDSVVTVKSLLEIINESMIKWQLFINEDRVDHFSSGKGELYYLKKTSVNPGPVFTRSH